MSSEAALRTETRPPTSSVLEQPRARRRFELGLLGRISIALVAVGLLPLGTAAFRLIRMNLDAMTEQVLRTHAVAAQTTAARVEAFLSARRYVAEVAARSEVLASDPFSPAAAGLLSELLRSAEGMAAVSVRNPAGQEVIRAQRKELATAIEEVLALPGSREMTAARAGGASWLRIDLPLGLDAWDTGDRLERGRLQVVCDLAPLLAELRPEELGEQAELVMVDGEGVLVAGAAGALERFPEPMLEVAMSGRVSGSGRFAEREAAVLGAYAPVDGADWIVLSRQPARVAEATARGMRSRSLVSLAIAVALVVALVAGARRSIVEPIRALIREQHRLAGSAGRPISAGSEIEQLKATFAVLERRLRDREALGELFLGRYRVQSVVGEGAMGTVFRGWDPALERPVAIKTVRFDRWLESERAELAGRLLGEAVTVARFSHPNIVGLYDIEESPEVAYLAMEYVDGVSLERHIEAHGRLPVREVIPIATAVASGLEAAHDRGIVHHDIKPANVLLGRDGAIKVVDFGVSQVITSAAEHSDVLFGTPGFIPPESLRGEPYGPSGDLFALGVTLYLMLTGELPFAGSSLQETLKRTLFNSIVPAGELVAGIPAELDSLVASLLEKDPGRRCPTAAEARRKLERLAAELGIDWEPPALPESDLELERTAKISPSQLVSRPRGGSPEHAGEWGRAATAVVSSEPLPPETLSRS